MKQKNSYLIGGIIGIILLSIVLYRFINNSEGKSLENKYINAKEILENEKTTEVTYNDTIEYKKSLQNTEVKIKFSYEVDGQKYSQTSTFGNENILKMYVNSYTTIYYNPKDPNKYTFDPERDFNLWKERHENHKNEFPLHSIVILIGIFLLLKKYFTSFKVKE